MRDTTTHRLRHFAGRVRARLRADGADSEASAEVGEALARQQAALDDLTARTTALEEALGATPAAAAETRNADYDRWTGEIIARTLSPGLVGVDVGAHTGLIFDAIRAAAPDARHWAFEPLPELAEGLRVAYPDAEVHQLALADAAGSTTFHHVTSNPSFSGILERDYTGPEEISVIEVEMARMDDIIPADVAVAFVKIDVEGAELGVLKGASRIIDQHRPVVVFEFGPGAADHYGTTPAAVYAFLAEHDMSVSLLDAYLRGEPPLTAEELAHQYHNVNFYFVAHPTPV